MSFKMSDETINQSISLANKAREREMMKKNPQFSSPQKQKSVKKGSSLKKQTLVALGLCAGLALVAVVGNLYADARDRLEPNIEKVWDHANGEEVRIYKEGDYKASSSEIWDEVLDELFGKIR